MNTLVVTGGAGFIGTNLVRLLLESTAYRIVVIDKLTYASNPLALTEVLAHSRVEFVKGDIADASAVSRVFQAHRPVGVLNLAAETHVDRSIDGARAFVDTNITGTLNLLEQARHYLTAGLGASAEGFRFLHVSTDEVFGTLGPTGRFTETSPYAPNSPYAASKASADHLVRAFHETYGLPTLVTNCSNNYGPFQHPEKLIPLMVLNALEARPLPIYGNGSNVRDWLHVDDHCAGLLTVFENGRPGRTYAIGGDNERNNIEIVDLICDCLEEVVPAATNQKMQEAGFTNYRGLKRFVADRPGHDRRYAIDATRMREELGWKPRWKFSDGLRATVAWYVVHREAFSQAVVGYDRERLGLVTSAKS